MWTFRQPVYNRLNSKYCTGTVKHVGEHVMVCGYFSGECLGPLQQKYFAWEDAFSYMICRIVF